MKTDKKNIIYKLSKYLYEVVIINFNYVNNTAIMWIEMFDLIICITRNQMV